MRKRTGYTFLGLLLSCAFFLPLLSATAVQPYQPSPSPAALGELWRWHHIAELDHEGVRSMASTPDGAIWFGVNNGVLRYDGKAWERHTLENGFVDVNAEKLAVSDDGMLYALSRNRLFRYDGAHWEKILPPGNRDLSFTCLVSSKDGGVWLGSTIGLFYINGESIKLITDSRHVKRAKDLFADDIVIEIMPRIRDTDRSTLTGVFEDELGIITIGYNSGWFVQIDTRRPLNEPGACHALKVPKDEANRLEISMVGGSDGEVWAGFGARVYTLDFPGGKYARWPLSETRSGEQHGHSLICSDDNELLIASPSYLFLRSGGQWRSFSYPRPDMSNFPLMMLDGNQNLWVGKVHGRVYRVDLSNDRWETFSGLIFQAEDPSGAHWFLDLHGHVVRRHEGEWTQYDRQDGLMEVPVALLCSRAGRVWVVGSDQQKAASAYLDEQGRWQKTIHPRLPRGISPSSLFEDSGGSIWFGGFGTFPQTGGGVVEAEPDGQGGYRFTRHAAPGRVGCITELPDQTLFFGAYALWESKDSQLRRIRNKDARPIEKYYAMVSGRDGSLWVAAEGIGVQNYRQGKWTAYTQKDGLSDNMVGALCCPKVDHVWALGANGLSFFDGRAWTPNIYGELFPGLSRLRGSIRPSSDGSLWLNYISPQWLWRSGSAYKPDSNITFKTIRCRSVSSPPETQIIDSMERLALPGSMTVRWKGTSPWKQTMDDALYYSWRLNDGKWSPYSLNRDVTLRSLKPGRHTFEVRARDYDLNVDPTPAAISFIAVAPVWQQAWFILLVLLFIALVLLAIWQWMRIHEVRAVAEEKYATDMERMKLRFFTNISHELRTPLTVLLGTLKSVMADPKLALNESLAMALRNARKLQSLVNEMLDLRKLEQGEWKLEPKYGDVVLFVKEIVESLRPMAADRDITIRMVEADPALVWFDPGKLNKIVSNLISNAIKYGTQGGQVIVQVEAADQAGSLEIRVEDDGAGIKADELPRIFDRFYQGTGMNPVKSASSGIGLSFTKELVELWGGGIEVESPLKEGRGTRFTVNLPLNIEPRAGADAESEVSTEHRVNGQVCEHAEAEVAQSGDKEKILVVDDDADLRCFVCDELSDQYACYEAYDGDYGYHQAVEIIPDLILCDVMMPGIGGLELCARLKSNELTQTIPIILLTGRTNEGGELEGLQSGVDDYITKPFEIDKLEARIRNLLKCRRQLRERYSKEIAEAPKSEPEHRMEDPFLQRAKEIIGEHLGDYKFDVNVLAEKMSVSSSSLWRKLKLAAEKTPATLIRELRLQQAYLRLQQEGVLIDEVAEQVGFLDTNYFRRCFKKQFGITPGQCRDGLQSLSEADDTTFGPEDAPVLTALVVEDDADLRRYLCDELKALHYAVVEAENGQIGLKKALEALPDVIVTDLMMPVMDGLQLCKEIKKSDLTNHIPVVMMTARTDSKIEIEGLDVGADDYINKPFEMDVLGTRLRNLLENRKVMAARYRRQITEPSEGNCQTRVEDPFLQRIVACIEEHLENPSFSVEMMAELLEVTPRTLQRKIPALSDLSPNALIKTMRLKKACQLLKTTDMPIGQVASACGFENRKYFSIQFRQQYGESPSQMRMTLT